MPGRIVFKTTNDGAATTTERMRITSSGKVGIAEDDPQEMLHINNGASSTIMLGNTTHGYKLRANVTGSNDYGFLIEDEDGVDLYNVISSTGTSNSNTHRFYTGGTERMRIDSNGAVRIGNFGSIGQGTNGTIIPANGILKHSRPVNAGNTVVQFFGNLGRFQTMGNGNAQNSNNNYGGTSDQELKENIVDANSQWNDIKALKVRNYNFKESTGYNTHKQIGVIAQELEVSE